MCRHYHKFNTPTTLTVYRNQINPKLLANTLHYRIHRSRRNIFFCYRPLGIILYLPSAAGFWIAISLLDLSSTQHKPIIETTITTAAAAAPEEGSSSSTHESRSLSAHQEPLIIRNRLGKLSSPGRGRQKVSECDSVAQVDFLRRSWGRWMVTWGEAARRRGAFEL